MFENLLSLLGFHLSTNNIPYMIIGGQAVLVHGVPRLTKDIDITMGISTDRLNDMVKICQHANLAILPENYEEFVNKTYILPARDETSGIRIDFIFSFTKYEKQAIKKSKQILIKDIPVNFASVEDLIIHKVFAGRSRDLEDIRNIIIKNMELDVDYVNKWLSEFDKTGEKTNLVSLFLQVWDDIKESQE